MVAHPVFSVKSSPQREPARADSSATPSKGRRGQRLAVCLLDLALDEAHVASASSILPLASYQRGARALAADHQDVDGGNAGREEDHAPAAAGIRTRATMPARISRGGRSLPEGRCICPRLGGHELGDHRLGYGELRSHAETQDEAHTRAGTRTTGRPRTGRPRRPT